MTESSHQTADAAKSQSANLCSTVDAYSGSAEDIVKRHLYEPAPHAYTEAEYQRVNENIKSMLERENAAIIAYYYTDPLIQRLAEETGGVFLHIGTKMFIRRPNNLFALSI